VHVTGEAAGKTDTASTPRKAVLTERAKHAFDPRRGSSMGLDLSRSLEMVRTPGAYAHSVNMRRQGR
jgi:hypothetical protein